MIGDASVVSDDLSSLGKSQALLRGRRLMQIASLTIAGLVFVAVRAALFESAVVAVILCAGIATMGYSLYLNWRGLTTRASNLYVIALTVMVAFLMWRGEGIRDSAMLAFPAVLVVAALLVSARYFVWVAAAMVAIVVGIAASTHLGWRTDQALTRVFDRASDAVIILVISGFAVWIMLGDLRHLLKRLEVQLERYREAQQNLTYLSQHDALTQLPNRILGRSRIEQAIAVAQRNGGHVALLFVDLDNFKSVNDSYGHTTGDDFLKQVAQRLVGAVRKTDVVCRQGGDEFLIGITEIAQGDSVSAVAGKILAHMAELFVVRGNEIPGSCSIGIALYPDNGADFETLLRNADTSVGHAKEAGRNLMRFYDPSMNNLLQENLQLVAGLRNALARDEFVLHYQPVLDIASGRLVGAEALIRWNSPDRGMVAPGLFIPAAEKSGLIVEIGQWVIQEACRQMVAWRKAGYPPFVLAINLSPVQFRRGNIEGVIADALTASGLGPEALELEVTESTLIQDSERFILALQGLKAMGLRIAIDDFGTGYSNLSYLQRFSIDKLKIDQSFVRRLMDGPQEQAIVSAIIHIASSLHLTTTAEGIEDEPTRRCLAELGCDQGQGYLFARPMPAGQFAAWLSEKS